MRFSRRIENIHCTRCGIEASPDTNEPVGWTAGPDGEGEVRCPECVIGAHQQATEVRFGPARLGQWTQGKVQENQSRRIARRQDLTLVKAPSRESRADDSGRYWPATVDNDGGVWGCRLPVNPDAGTPLDGVEEYLTHHTTRTEIMEYLSQAYGPAFVEDLIQRLGWSDQGSACIC